MYEDIVLFGQENQNREFNVLMCGISYCDESYRINRPASSHYCIEYIYKGCGYVSVDGVSFIAEENDIYLLPEGADHFYFSDKENPWKKIWFNISGEFVKNTILSYGLENVYHLKNTGLAEYFEKFISDARILKEADVNSNNFDVCAVDFLKIIQKASSQKRNSSVTAPPDYAQQLKQKIDALSDFSLSFDELISEFYCTKSHLIRIFKDKYGIPPYSYLLEKKSNAAKILLKNTAMSIKEISVHLGFEDAHYFSNFFKKRTGISPYRYRKGL